MKFTNEKNIKHKSSDISPFGTLLSMGLILLRVVFAILSVVFFIWFILPMPAGIIDIGNILGIIMCACCFLICTNPFAFFLIKGAVKENKVGKFVINILYIFICICVLYSIVISCFMAKAANKQAPSDDTTLVVLGCKVDGEKPSKSLHRRLDAAYNYLTEHPNVKCIVSGGKGNNEKISEAQCMYNFLTEKGIENKRIYMENKSTNTYENLNYSMNIIEENNLSTNITVVTDGYHQLRAEIIGRKNNISIKGAVSSDTPIEVLPTYWVREWLAIPVEIIK